MTFQLDTTGAVGDVRWGDLTPLAQGYTEALPWETLIQGGDDGLYWMPTFSDLAPETVERIVEDCALACEGNAHSKGDAQGGREFWAARQKGRLTASGRWHAFPPLTVFLGDDGKVYLRETGQ